MLHRRPSSLQQATQHTASVDALVLACAASAGIHAALAAGHLRESPPAGALFVLAAALLLCAGIGLAIRPDRRDLVLAAGVLLAGLIAVWAASRIAALPLLQSRPERVEAVGLLTKSIEAGGLVFAIWLSQPSGGRRPSAPKRGTR